MSVLHGKFEKIAKKSKNFRENREKVFDKIEKLEL